MEMAVSGRHVHLNAHLHYRILLQTEGDEVADADKLKPPLIGLATKFRETCHSAVVAHYLHQRGRGLQTSQPGEIHGGLRMSASLDHAPVLCVKGIDMTRAAKSLRPGSRVGKGAYRGGAVFGGNSVEHPSSLSTVTVNGVPSIEVLSST